MPRSKAKAHRSPFDYPKVSLDTARLRLRAYRREHGAGLYKANTLADVIWPGRRWRSTQGAGGAATRVLKALGCHWNSRNGSWGWHIPALEWFRCDPISQKEIHGGCLCCPEQPLEADLGMSICVGFGWAVLTRDGEVIYDGQEAYRKGEEIWTIAEAEKVASADPDNDWRVTLDGPLRGITYQRHGPEKWVAIESNMGFA